MNIQGLFGYRLQYEGGLPDITNPCKVIVRFKDDQAIITFLDIRYLGKKVLIKPQDIVELSFGGFVSGCEALALCGRAACTKPLLAAAAVNLVGT